MDLQETSEVAQEMPLPEHTPMTVEEFLARDIEGTDADTLTGEDVVSGFSCRVAQFFE